MPQTQGQLQQEVIRSIRSFVSPGGVSAAMWSEIKPRTMPPACVVSVRELGGSGVSFEAPPADRFNTAAVGKLAGALAASPARNSSLAQATRAEIE